MTEYVCSNCAERTSERGFNVAFFLTMCDNDECSFESYVNTDKVDLLLEQAKNVPSLTLSKAFKERYGHDADEA